MDIVIFANATDLFNAAIADFARRAKTAIAEKGEFAVVFSGGSTGKVFFDALSAASSQQQIPWPQIKIFFADERYVPADNAESNYLLAKQHLFDKVPVLPENIFRIPTEFSDPQAAAEHYESTIRHQQFDLVYLGLGEDAHTASLMPGSEVVKKNDRLVASLWVPHLKMYRITLTPRAINHSAHICFLVTGENKAPAVSQTIEGPFNPEKYPAQWMKDDGDKKVIWYLDQAAAGKLSRIK